MKTEKTREILIANAMKRVFRPFVKLMLANNLTYTFIIDVIKALFVEVADQEFSQQDKRTTDARISLMSGVHRKDVKRLRELQPDVEDVMPENVSLGSQLVAVWNANPKYLNTEGMPKPLARFSSTNSEESFEALVRSLSTDIHPRAVLDEWLRLGVARVDDDNFVHLTTDMYIAQEGFEEKVYYFGHNLHDHAEAAISNVMSSGSDESQPSFLERCVHYDTLSVESVNEITALAKKLGMRNLREINKFADALAVSDANKPEANMRMTYGIYYYYEQTPTTSEQAKTKVQE